ncbi:MAG: LptF/LptG family permease [Bacteroidales bacterium]|jgi:lipopolysaccharide export system permease protein|nr:LptF/LptG family permease [Bacteroidales bacterium]NLM92217.1 YjgP/YjgQ family permease [Bacteroidales bacterium]
MKKLHKLVLQSYLGPFVVTFFIALFIILMQFVWKYIDDLVGKGLEWYIIAELLFYASATFVPMALPLAVLLSSIMTMGSMGEHYELVGFKSAGISLRKILWPMVVISLFLVVVAFYFSNNVLPVANLKMYSLLYDVRQQRPAFNIMEGVYYKGIENYVIKVEDKDSDGTTLRDIKIYDHTDKRGNVNLTVAEWGTMLVTPDKRTLVFTLYNGTNYQDIQQQNPRDQSKPFQRTQFSEQIMRFDLSAFDLTRTDEELFKSHFQMLTLDQLIFFEDSLSGELKTRKESYLNDYYKRLAYFSLSDTEKLGSLTEDQIVPVDFMTAGSTITVQQNIDRSVSLVRSNKDHTFFSQDEFRQRGRTLARYQIEFHRKFTLSFACVVLFLIGAPLGAIIRKGGFGLPVVISVLFFVVFHVLSITGEKFAREGVLAAHQGMWIAPLVLLPIGILLTIKASTDSSLFDIDSYVKRFEKFVGVFRRTDDAS